MATLRFYLDENLPVTDYVELATSGLQHAGIIVGQPEKHWIAEWVKGLTLYHTVYTAEDMMNRLDYL